MAVTPSVATLIEKWETLFKEYFKKEIENIALSYPEKRSVTLDYWDIDRIDTDLAEYLLEKPNNALYTAEEALKKIDVPVDPPPLLHFRIRNLSDINKIPIRKIRSQHLGKLLAIDGLVKKITEVRPKLQDAAYQCQKCGAILRILQEGDTLKEPMECYEEQGGCGRQTLFKLLTEDSRFIDSQKIEVQESPEGLRGGEQPQRLTTYLEDDLVGNIVPGDRVIVNGILYGRQRIRGRTKLTEFDKVMNASSIEQLEQAFEEVQISDEDEEKILQVSKDTDIYNKMRQSISPILYGLDREKDALVLQLFGGVPKIMADETRIRGDIHILLVGDPGTGKSQLLRYIAQLAPRSIYTSGKSSSAAGLTASAVRSDEFGEGHWTLEAGALVLADLGISCVDELDKMNPTDRDALHQAMEQQEISVAKAGINATLKSRCALLGAANPKLGRFDEYIPIHEQITMPPTLLSRFDLIFSITDKPDKTRDTNLATHVLRVHKAGEIHENIQRELNEADEGKDIITENSPIYEPSFLRKYIAYAKRHIFPVLSDHALEEIKNYYVTMRSASQDSIPFTPRQLEAFVRLTEASARIRLDKTAGIEDAQRAIRIVEDYLKKVGVDRETGFFDIDVIQTGISHSQQERMRILLKIIKQICSESKSGLAPREDIITMAESEGIEAALAEGALNKLRINGQIFEPKPTKYRLP